MASTTTSKPRAASTRTKASGYAAHTNTASKTTAKPGARPAAAPRRAPRKTNAAPAAHKAPVPVAPEDVFPTVDAAASLAGLQSALPEAAPVSQSNTPAAAEHLTDMPAPEDSLPGVEVMPFDPPKDSFPALLDDNTDSAPTEDIDLDALRLRMTALQQAVHAAGIPVVIVLEGWHAAGKGTMVSKLITGLDPRGYQVYPVGKPIEEERAFPPMRRYYANLPAKGNISIFCGSWYREVSNACFESKAARKHLNQRYDDIVSLESQLVSDGALIIKFFLHIPRKEQKARLKTLESKKLTRWRVDKDDWAQNENYAEYLRLYDAMIARTHFEGALWHVLRSDNRRACTQQIFDIVISEFESALQERQSEQHAWDTPYLQHLESITPLTMPDLETFDPEQVLIDPYKPAMDKAQKQLQRLQNELYCRGISLVAAFEGWDAAGKGGAIRRLTSALDARGYDVIPISAPTPLEKSHHHLWRFWTTLPKDGNITIFDRTWYGRVLVERIEGFCTEAQWKRAYEEINRFEAEIVAHGTVLVKFWLQIDKETQLIRFNDRADSEDKQWKITEEDWRNREKWDAYAVAVNDMLQKTHTAAAPWTVVEANNKQFARLKVLQTVIHAIEERLASVKD